jgi:hypothetical protein
MIIVLLRVLKKRYRILTAGILGVKRIVGLAHEYLLGWLRGKGSPEGFPSGGGLGVSPSYKIPQDWGIRGLIKII